MTISKAYAIGARDDTAGATLTTSTFDSTGYTHLVVFTKWETNSTDSTVADNKSSTGWTALTKQQMYNSQAGWSLVHWATIGTAGTGHTVTMTTNSAANFRGMVVWLVNATSGIIELVDETTANGTSATLSAGTLSNAGADSVVSFAGFAQWDTVTYTQGSGWSEDYDNGHYGESRGAETTTSITADCTSSTGMDYAAVAAMFREGTPAAVAPPIPIVQSVVMR